MCLATRTGISHRHDRIYRQTWWTCRTPLCRTLSRTIRILHHIALSGLSPRPDSVPLSIEFVCRIFTGILFSRSTVYRWTNEWDASGENKNLNGFWPVWARARATNSKNTLTINIKYTMQSFIAIAISSTPAWKSTYERRLVARELLSLSLCVWMTLLLMLRSSVVPSRCHAVAANIRFAPSFEHFYAILDVVSWHIVSLGRSIVGKIGEQVERETRLTSISIFHNWKWNFIAKVGQRCVFGLCVFVCVRSCQRASGRARTDQKTLRYNKWIEAWVEVYLASAKDTNERHKRVTTQAREGDTCGTRNAGNQFRSDRDQQKLINKIKPKASGWALPVWVGARWANVKNGRTDVGKYKTEKFSIRFLFKSLFSVLCCECVLWLCPKDKIADERVGHILRNMSTSTQQHCYKVESQDAVNSLRAQ